MPFESLEQIDQHYKEAFDRAKGRVEVLAELKAEKAQVVADFRLRAIELRERQSWLRDALHDFPLAKEFPELVAGETEEAVRDAAQQLHERLVAIAANHQRQQRVAKLVEQHMAANPDGEPSPQDNQDAAGT